VTGRLPDDDGDGDSDDVDNVANVDDADDAAVAELEPLTATAVDATGALVGAGGDAVAPGRAELVQPAVNAKTKPATA
jgi:hypothetical protein